MKIIRTLLLSSVLTLTALVSAQAQDVEGQPRAFLAGQYDLESLKKIIIPRDDWHPYPNVNEPEGWKAIPDAVRNGHIALGENALGAKWESLPATVFLEFVRTGNRTNYERLTFGRRTQLAQLVLAEVMEGKGRFIDDIVNGIWAISEESFWGIPPHLAVQRAGRGLPDVAEPIVDLFAAETGGLLAWTLYLVGDRLDEISPLIRERIHLEVDRRILTPNLEREDFWWMGYGPHNLNNWNPWINSNWLTMVLLLERDEERRLKSIHKIMYSLDQFIDGYPSDGGSDEGPSYWSRAAGSMLDALELLRSASGGAIDIYDEPLIQEMGKFIYRTYISSDYFINFADASPRINVAPALVFQYGRAIEDPLLTGFAAFAAEKQGWGEGAIPGSFGSLGRQLPALFLLDDLRSTPTAEPQPLDFWLKDIQVMGARSVEGSSAGLYVAAKGGHNFESHNHNDIGNFIVYANGRPVLIDVGSGVYNATTFGEHRYTNWNVQSAFHNVPTINGIMQKDGREYTARNVKYSSTARQASLTLDIAGAYPEEAAVQSWVRTVTLNRGQSVEIRDEYRLEEIRGPLTLNLMTSLMPDVHEPGRITLAPADGAGASATIDFDQERFDVTFEPILLDDARMQRGWGDRLTRIVLTAKQPLLADTFVITIRL